MLLTAVLLGLVTSATLLEVGSRLIWLRLQSGWSERMGRVTFFYQRSANPALGYELAPGYALKGDRGFVNIDGDGLRLTERSPENAARTIALAGDSVVFGSGHRQGQTSADFLQQLLNAAEGEPARVVNFGVPGYSFAETREFFESKAAKLTLDSAVLVVNLNDFSRRDTIYEGGDNGLYRMYVPPRSCSAYFLRKAAYRLRRNSLFDSNRELSPEWYRWLFAANRNFGLAEIERMNSFAQARGIRFDVVLFPSGQAYGPSGEYGLENIHRQITGHLEQRGIRFLDAAEAFRKDHDRLIDRTDHPTLEGNRKLAEIIASLIE